MLATVRSQVARAPLTVLLQQRRLLRHMASGALSRVPGRVFPLLASPRVVPAAPVLRPPRPLFVSLS